MPIFTKYFQISKVINHDLIVGFAHVSSAKLSTVEVKIKFPFGFRSTELKRYTVLTKNSYKTNKHL